MKPETKLAKLGSLLGIDEETILKLASDDNPIKKKKRQEEHKTQPKLYGYTDDEFKNIRILQGTLYFLKAPELFTTKQCSNCSEWFTVSRKAVGYCSYECLAESFRKDGFSWTIGGDLERLTRDVYDGNEPLWTIPTSQLKRCLQAIIEATESTSTTTSPVSVEAEPDTSSQTTPKSSSSLQTL